MFRNAFFMHIKYWWVHTSSKNYKDGVTSYELSTKSLDHYWPILFAFGLQKVPPFGTLKIENIN